MNMMDNNFVKSDWQEKWDIRKGDYLSSVKHFEQQQAELRRTKRLFTAGLVLVIIAIFAVTLLIILG